MNIRGNNILKVWGAGSIFAFSGLDGENTFENSLVGYLKSDGIGVVFNSISTVEIAFNIKGAKSIKYNFVASDAVHFMTEHREYDKEVCFLFANEYTVAGKYHENAVPYISLGAVDVTKTEGGMVIYSSGDEHIAFIKEEGRFAICVSKKSQDDAIERVREGLVVDIDTLLESKYDFFEKLPKSNAGNTAIDRTLAKCFSVMKSQVYTPEKEITCRWTTPDRMPHKKMWLWDSVFHSMGNKYISKQLATDSIEALFCFQNEDGFIPHMMSPCEASEVTQPPVIAWGAYKLYEFFGDESILERFYKKTKKFLIWVMKNRDANYNNLFEWELEDNPNCRCSECGMDNSPRFDDAKAMDCVDFSCFMANEARYMEKTAAILGLPDDEKYWNDKYSDIKCAINNMLWSEEDGFYFDMAVDTGVLKKVWAISSFLPLFAGVCEKHHAEKLLAHLKDKRKFNTALPIPSVAVDDETFGTDMWRGPVWINYNYMVLQGLKEYGFIELAYEITEKMLDIMTFWYEQEGVIYEFYDSENRVSPSRLNRKGKPIFPYSPKIKMQTIRDYGWSAALFVDIILMKKKER